MAGRIVGLLTVAIVAVMCETGIAGASAPRLTASAQRAAIEVRGSSFSCRAPVSLRAFVVGVSPYLPRASTVPRPAHGRFRARLSLRGVSDTLPWTVEASQRCGSVRQRVGTQVRVTAAAASLARGPLALASVLQGGVSSYSVDAATLNMIANNEGTRRNKAGLHILYNDPAGHCTIGYGHLVHEGACNGSTSEAPYRNGLTEPQARALLARDAQHVADAIGQIVHVPLNQGQVDALADFIFNVGVDAFRGSTLVRLLNQGRYDQVPAQLNRWVHATDVRGRVIRLPGLVARRLREGALFALGGLPSGGGGGGGGPSGFSLDLALNFRDLHVVDQNNPNGFRDLGTGAGYVVVTEPGGVQHAVGCTTDPGCERSAHFSFPAGAKVTLQAFPFPDSTFQGWSSGGSSGPGCAQASSTVCTLTLSAAATVTAHFGVKTFTLTIVNKAPDDGGVFNGSPGGEGISCGLDGAHVYDVCSAVERAHTPFYMTVQPGRPNLARQLYLIGSLDCGSAERFVATPAISGWCKFGTSEGDQTITVDWATDSGSG